MNILDKLASALERNDERPNVELAEALVAKPDKTAIADLAATLSGGTVAQQNDAIKVLYEIGERKPALVAPHAAAFLALLKSRNNRNVWGAMSAVDTIATLEAKVVSAALKDVLAAADKGSVIAKDKAMSILGKLALAGEKRALPALLERLENAAPNQFPMYSELALPAIGKADTALFRAVLETRLKTIEAPAKRARVEKVLRKLNKA
ncbi:MAG: hypothetical protein ABIO40_08820 [Devosia sp.]